MVKTRAALFDAYKPNLGKKRDREDDDDDDDDSDNLKPAKKPKASGSGKKKPSTSGSGKKKPNKKVPWVDID
jgi:hypothetical protein